MSQYPNMNSLLFNCSTGLNKFLVNITQDYINMQTFACISHQNCPTHLAGMTTQDGKFDQQVQDVPSEAMNLPA